MEIGELFEVVIQDVLAAIGLAPPEPPRYALELKWGDLSALFNGTVATVRGRQERMMALGFFYGNVDGVDGPVTRRCELYMGEQLGSPIGTRMPDAELRQRLGDELKTIVQKDDGSGQHEPDPLKDVRVVYPGSFCFTRDDQLGNPARAHHRLEAEKKAWSANLGLGRVPLLVKVTRRGTNAPAKDVDVVFEFVSTASDVKKHLPDPATVSPGVTTSVSSQVEAGQVFVASHPDMYLRTQLEKDPDAAVPFDFNCVDAKGGRKPKDVLGTLVASGKVHGFKHTASAKGRPNKTSVVARTDAEGETGIVLRLPRTAGDRFKLRISIHPKRGKGVVLEPDAGEKKETGVLTVWRQLRLGRIIVKPQNPVPAGLAPPIDAAHVGPLGQAGVAGCPAPYGVDTDLMKKEYAKAFHRLVVDREAATPVVLDAATYAAAIRWARARVSNPGGYDLDALVRDDFASPYLFWIRDDATYNANRRAGTTALDLTSANVWEVRLRRLVDDLVTQFCQYFTENAAPGLTMFRSEVGDSYSYCGDARMPASVQQQVYTTSGVACTRRGFYVWYPSAMYSGDPDWYSVTGNVMHEMGHTLYLRHHYTSRAAGAPDPASGFPANHDRLDHCIMGYLRRAKNDHCGACLLKLRGWDEAKL